MAKRTNRYELTLKRIGVPGNEEQVSGQIHLVVANHDDIFAIIEKLKQKIYSLISSNPLNLP